MSDINHIPKTDDPGGIVSRLLDRVEEALREALRPGKDLPAKALTDFVDARWILERRLTEKDRELSECIRLRDDYKAQRDNRSTQLAERDRRIVELIRDKHHFINAYHEAEDRIALQDSRISTLTAALWRAHHVLESQGEEHTIIVNAPPSASPQGETETPRWLTDLLRDCPPDLLDEPFRCGGCLDVGFNQDADCPGHTIREYLLIPPAGDTQKGRAE